MKYESRSPGKYQPHVLCVDDEEPRLLLTALILQASGYRVTALVNPCKAAKIFEQKDIDLAVVDYHMAEMSGARLAAQLKTRSPEVKVVLFTGALQVPQPDLLSVDAVVHKSDGTETLLETVEGLLATPAISGNLPQRGTSAVRAWEKNGYGKAKVGRQRSRDYADWSGSMGHGRKRVGVQLGTTR